MTARPYCRKCKFYRYYGHGYRACTHPDLEAFDRVSGPHPPLITESVTDACEDRYLFQPRTPWWAFWRYFL